jgi:hypothetical protein
MKIKGMFSSTIERAKAASDKADRPAAVFATRARGSISPNDFTIAPLRM